MTDSEREEWRKQFIERFVEAIALDHIVPFRVIPPPDQALPDSGEASDD